MYTLYVIPGAHTCRSAMLMLEHKGLSYRTVQFVPPLQPVMVRLHGFKGNTETRVAGSQRTFGLRLGDQLGTVPALNADGERVMTNRRIARLLDERHPDPPLFPADPERRRAAEEVEAWGNGPFQMLARRLALSAAVQDPDQTSRRCADGRMGYLLYRRPAARRVMIPWIGRMAFAVGRHTDRELLDELPSQLDKIDGWIAEGLLGGEQLNAADCMVVPGLALITYRRDGDELLAGRPALELVDRVLPDPARRPTAVGA